MVLALSEEIKNKVSDLRPTFSSYQSSAEKKVAPVNVLVTGCAGFIGSRLAQWILENKTGVRVFGIDNLSSGFQENVPPGVTFENCDLTHYPSRVCFGCNGSQWRGDSGYIQECPICNGSGKNVFHYVFHCAAFAAECLSPFVREHCYKNNIVGTANLLNNIITCGVTKRIVFLSSVAAYGRGKPPFKETDVCVPQDPYGISKLASENDIRVAGEQHGLNWTVLRLFNVYGPGQSLWDKSRNVFGIWMKQKLCHEYLTVFGNGQQRRSFTYIDDILPIIWDAAVDPVASKEVFNVGSATPYTIEDALLKCVPAMGGAEGVIQLPMRHEAQAAYCDVSKSNRLFGHCKTELGEGLPKMFQWAQETYSKYPDREMKAGPPLELKCA